MNYTEYKNIMLNIFNTVDKTNGTEQDKLQLLDVLFSEQ